MGLADFSPRPQIVGEAIKKNSGAINGIINRRRRNCQYTNGAAIHTCPPSILEKMDMRFFSPTNAPVVCVSGMLEA